MNVPREQTHYIALQVWLCAAVIAGNQLFCRAAVRWSLYVEILPPDQTTVCPPSVPNK